MSRTKLVAANWKMNLTVPEGLALAESVTKAAASRPEVEVVLCPSFTSLRAIGEHLKGGKVRLGAQDVFWMDKGAYTGKISAQMLLDAGCKYCIVGHSETRGRFGKSEIDSNLLGFFSDTNETVGLKLQTLMFANLLPILCVGESADERKQGQTDSVISEQLRAAVTNLAPEECSTIAIAYEPVWAIGTGDVCDAQEAGRVCAFIRLRLGEYADLDCASQARILYGGSVKADNCAALFAQSEIDGALVGGASLNAEEFSRIIFAA